MRLRNHHDKIVKMVRDGVPLSEMADRMGVKLQAMSSYLSRRELDPITQNWDWVMEQYGHTTLNAIAKELGVGSSMLRKHLRKAGVYHDGCPQVAIQRQNLIKKALHSDWS